MFKIGDEVSWTSQSGGVSRTKTGKIVAVVPSGRDTMDYVPSGMSGDFGAPRDHESYLVQVGESKNLYWPLVSKLEKVEVAEVPSDELPGIPPPGPLHNAIKKFVHQRKKIEEEQTALKALGQDILKAMEEEKKPALSIPVAGETYVFKVTSASSRLKMQRVRKEKAAA